MNYLCYFCCVFAENLKLFSKQLVQRLFRLRHTVNVVNPATHGGITQLARDCLQLTHDSRHCVVMTAIPLAEGAVPLSSIYQNNESLTRHASIQLETYVFYTIDVLVSCCP